MKNGNFLVSALISVIILALSGCGFDGSALAFKEIPGTPGTQGIAGTAGIPGQDGQNGLSCTVEQTVFGAAILCEDGTQANIYNGKDGTSCSVEKTDTGAAVTCGDNTVDIANGTDGNNGLDGSSCSAIVTEGGKFVICSDGTSFQVFDGINGSDGTDGKDSIIAILDPCGKQSNYDEIFLKLSTGQMIAVYDDMSINKIHLVNLVPGNYVTTDGTHCFFSVDSAGNIINEHN